jgi:hypothetical protein
MIQFDPKISLDQPVIYQICVPGILESNWLDWGSELRVTIEQGEVGKTVTTLTGSFDQAGLHGLLRRLYASGLPIISVNYVPHLSADDKQQE